MLTRLISTTYDWLSELWEGERTRHFVAGVLVAVFVGDVFAIELARRGLLLSILGSLRGHNHFHAVEIAFSLLLAFEVVGLVFAVSRSISGAAGKQLEIFSLILLRHSFEEFAHLAEPITWEGSHQAVGRMVANGFGALAIFVVLGLTASVVRPRPLSADPRDTLGFILAKKTLALALLAVFTSLAVRAIFGGHPEFFESFYTVLVLADILIVLVSLRYSSAYVVVFRNSGLAVATVLLRVALAAPPYANAALGLASALFTLGLTVATRRFAPTLLRHPVHGVEGEGTSAGAAHAS
jgi:hypothetical protein